MGHPVGWWRGETASPRMVGRSVGDDSEQSQMMGTRLCESLRWVVKKCLDEMVKICPDEMVKKCPDEMVKRFR